VIGDLGECVEAVDRSEDFAPLLGEQRLGGAASTFRPWSFALLPFTVRRLLPSSWSGVRSP